MPSAVPASCTEPVSERSKSIAYIAAKPPKPIWVSTVIKISGECGSSGSTKSLVTGCRLSGSTPSGKVIFVEGMEISGAGIPGAAPASS